MENSVTIREERLSAEEYIGFLGRTDLGSQYPKERFRDRIAKLVNTVRLSNTIRTRLSGRLMRPAFLSFIDGRQPICFIQDCLNTSSIPLRSQISEPRGRPETRRRFADGPSPFKKR